MESLNDLTLFQRNVYRVFDADKRMVYRNYNKCHQKSIRRRKNKLKNSSWNSEKDVEVKVFRNFWFVPMANNHIWMHDVNIAIRTHISLPQFSRQPGKGRKDESR